MSHGVQHSFGHFNTSWLYNNATKSSRLQILTYCQATMPLKARVLISAKPTLKQDKDPKTSLS